MNDTAQYLRMVEALLFAAAEPLDEASLAARLPEGIDLPALLSELGRLYEGRGVHLVKVANKWTFRTASDLAFLLERERTVPRRLSKAAVETLAIIAYHQPITRAEIEQVRGVSLSPGTLDILMESEWIRPRGRRKVPGRPLTYGTTDKFLQHFDLAGIADLPGLEDLRASGLLRADPPEAMVREAEEAALRRRDAEEGPLPDEAGLEEAGEAGDLFEPPSEDPSDERSADGERHVPIDDEGEEALPVQRPPEVAEGVVPVMAAPRRDVDR
ncbi:MAG: SMC-Scp complex subunit ScpB [Alphaproteobacteria bacterium]|nr:SMC-Scp complex subunit ScpB [Alphaproteobacteria bacterium]